DVKQAQDVAMADTEIPALDPNPQISALAADSRSASVLASADPAMAEIRTQLVKPVKEQADKKPLTLAALFRKKDTSDFDRDRFAKKKTSTRDIPNMRTAALSDDALPGVNVNAMFPTNAMNDDDEH